MASGRSFHFRLKQELDRDEYFGFELAQEPESEQKIFNGPIKISAMMLVGKRTDWNVGLRSVL